MAFARFRKELEAEPAEGSRRPSTATNQTALLKQAATVTASADAASSASASGILRSALRGRAAGQPPPKPLEFPLSPSPSPSATLTAAKSSGGGSEEAKERPTESEEFLPRIDAAVRFDRRSAERRGSIFRAGSGSQQRKKRCSLPTKLPELRHTGTHVTVYHALPFVELHPVPTFVVPQAVQELLMSGSYVTASRRSSLRSKSTTTTAGTRSRRGSADDASLSPESSAGMLPGEAGVSARGSDESC